MEDETLKKIAHELTLAIRNNITIDWSIRKSAQASMRSIIKRVATFTSENTDMTLANKVIKYVLRKENLSRLFKWVLAALFERSL